MATTTNITIPLFNGSNYKQWSTGMALLLEQKKVWGIILGTKYKPVVPETDATAAQLEKYSDWVELHGIARSTILLGLEPRLQSEYSAPSDAKELWTRLSNAYKANAYVASI